MIDWVNVFLNAVWILGLSILLSVIGIANYKGTTENIRLSKVLSESNYRIILDLGMILFCIGLAGLAGPWWQKLLWGLLSMSFLIMVWKSLISKFDSKHS